MKVLQERPESPSEEFQFGGQQFEAYNFIKRDDEGREYFNKPEFYRNRAISN